MSKKQKLALAVEQNTILHNKNRLLEMQNEELQIYKDMAIKEIAKLRAELADFQNCQELLINDFYIKSFTTEDGDLGIMIRNATSFVLTLPNLNELAIIHL
jgi:hypothetical protein